MILELGPVLTGLILAGRIGARYAAELGSMRVTEQIDALESLGRSPRYPFAVAAHPCGASSRSGARHARPTRSHRGRVHHRAVVGSASPLCDFEFGRATSSGRSTSGTRW